MIEDIRVPSWDLYELSIACTVFGKPQPDLADTWYDLRLCGIGERTEDGVPADAGIALRTRYGLADLVGADTVIVPSVPDSCVEEGEPLSPALIAALRDASDAGARMVSLCTGAFALAEAGLLDGRRATAHWMHTAQLAERYPKVRVDDSVLYVDDGDVLTSAGLSAGLDLCLHLVRRDLGAHVANQLARRMVVLLPPDRRSGPVHRPVRSPQRRQGPGPRTGLGAGPPGPASDRREPGAAGRDEPHGRSTGGSRRPPGQLPFSGSSTSAWRGPRACWSRRTSRSRRWGS